MDRTALSSAVLPSVTDRQVLKMTFFYCCNGQHLASVSRKSNQILKAKKNYKTLLVLTPTWKRYKAVIEFIYYLGGEEGVVKAYHKGFCVYYFEDFVHKARTKP